MIVATSRPTFKPESTQVQRFQSIALQRLDSNQVGRIAHQVTRGKPLPKQALELIAQRTDGVPLFVEELTRSMLETSFLVDAGDRFDLSGDSDPQAIPDTLQDILMARLDRLALKQ